MPTKARTILGSRTNARIEDLREARGEIPRAYLPVRHAAWRTVLAVACGLRTATNQRVNVSVACVVFETQNVRRNFFRASGRSGNISRSNGICCALHRIANSLQQGSLTGANSLNSPKIPRLDSKRSPHLPLFRLMLGKLTTSNRLFSEHAPIRASRLSASPLQVCGFRVRRPEFEVHENRYTEMCNHPTTGEAHASPTDNPGRGSCRISAS